jgi:hypothetical protein
MKFFHNIVISLRENIINPKLSLTEKAFQNVTLK